jgi:outer membrane lipoprotein-sorting protein
MPEYIMLKLAIFTAVLTCLASPADALGLTAAQIKADELMRGDTNYGRYEMTITTPHWQRTLKLQAWAQGKRKSFIHITYPAKERDITFLKIDYNLWNYLPKIERVIKIPPSMMMQSWMGSDFTNDDLVKESSLVDDYDHRLMGVEMLGDEKAYKLELIPKPNAPVVWGKIVFWARKEDCVPLREEFYSERGELKRVMTLSEIKKMHTRIIPTRWEVRSLAKPGHVTVLRVKDMEFDLPIPDEVFTLKNLKRRH